VHYYISLDDHLIRADDVLEHYNELKRHKPDLARVKVFKGFGHNDFTYGQHESMSLELRKTLRSFMTYPACLSQLAASWHTTMHNFSDYTDEDQELNP